MCYLFIYLFHLSIFMGGSDVFVVPYPHLNYTVVGMEILIKALSRCHKDHHKRKKKHFQF